jgi:flagellar basal-body rod protein FlgG
MMRALWTAASGMTGQQFNIDNISNNLSNVNTTGYKKSRVEFEDLLYQNRRIAGTPATELTVVPTGIQIGHGTRVAANQKMFSQGSIKQTDGPADMAITGEGFFRVQLYDGSFGYTRDGSFKVDSNRQIVTSNGYRMVPEVILPENYIQDSLAIGQGGRVTVRVPGNDDPIEVGRIQIYRFVNPAGLKAIGQNSFKVTPGSGDALGGRPGSPGFGSIQHKFLEMSNVAVAEEMVNMIVAQRAYELNSKAIQTSDTMLGIANGLKR